MNFTKVILAAIVGFVVMFALDYLWFGILFANHLPPPPDPKMMGSIPMHALGDFCLAFLMAIIYPMGFKGGSAMMEGAKFGVLIGLVAMLPSSIHQHAGGYWSLHESAVFILDGIIVGGITGIVIAMVYGGKKAAA